MHRIDEDRHAFRRRVLADAVAEVEHVAVASAIARCRTEAR